MRDVIAKAIEGLELLTFKYKGTQRTVEPHTFGTDTKGHETLCAWQLSGGSGQGFRDFHLSEMSGVQSTGDTFGTARAGYRRGDTTMTRIHAQL